MTAFAPAASPPALTHLQGSLLVLVSGVVFSFGGLAYRAAEAAGPWQYTIFRGLGALLVALIHVGFRHRRRLPALVRAVQPSHVLAGVLIGSISCLFIASLELASVAFVMFLQTASPITAAYFSWLLMRERVSRHVAIATAITLVGTAVMVSGSVVVGSSVIEVVSASVEVWDIGGFRSDGRDRETRERAKREREERRHGHSRNDQRTVYAYAVRDYTYAVRAWQPSSDYRHARCPAPNENHSAEPACSRPRSTSPIATACAR